MAVTIGHASKDENSKFSSGNAGDQTGQEVYTRNWYNANWNVVLRPNSEELAEKSAIACEQACANNNIGYDQYQRNTLYEEAKKVNWDISKITTLCECDCSSLMHVCAIIGGANLTYGSNGYVTFNMVEAFVRSGDYTKITDSKYCTGEEYLKRGDILVRESGHTAMVLGSGPYSNNQTDPSSTTSQGNSNLSSGYYRIVEAGGTTVGQRVSGVSAQPIHPFINIYVGDKLLATNPPKPNMIQSFEFDRKEGVGDKASFTVFDDTWEEIERAICANHDNIFIEYGYPGTGMKSRRYRMLMQNYNLSFESTGTSISVDLLSEEVLDNLKPKSMVLDTYNPTEAVKEICRNLGYTVLDENFDESSDIHADDPFNLVEDLPITYINTIIIPQASQENEELFKFEIDNDRVAYFKRESYDSTATDSLRTYIYQKGYDSNVISFEVDINAVFGGGGPFSVTTELRSSVFGTLDKTPEEYIVNTDKATTVATGDTVHTNSSQSSVVVDSAGYSPQQMKNQLYYRMKSDILDAYTATLVILGDPTISYNSLIRVINVTDNGYLHHTSGVYWVSEIIDSISGGQMTTTLKLYKNATAGDIDGVEIINPKSLLK